jgi:opacity protein-like surface antigen
MYKGERHRRDHLPDTVRAVVHITLMMLKEEHTMKKFGASAVIVCLLLSMATAGYAETGAASMAPEDFSIDGSFGFATGPGSFDQGLGVNFGAGYMLKGIDKNLQARVDLSFFEFEYDYWGAGTAYDLSYTRIPLTIGARYYFPIIERVRAFAQAGIETSYDSYDYYDNGAKHSKSEVNLGFTPGGGAEYFFTRNASAFALARVHMIADSYFSMQFGASFHF